MGVRVKKTGSFTLDHNKTVNGATITAIDIWAADGVILPPS
jgi:hypothetical protein